MKAAFLDRDGVINKDHGYVYNAADFEFTEGCIEALVDLQSQDYALIIVTNQSGIGRGYYSELEYQALTAWYREQLKERGVRLLDVFHCPHAPDANCLCRKPKPGLIHQALSKYADIDLAQSIMVGDKLSDMQAAQTAGIKQCYLVGSENSAAKGYPVFINLSACVKALGVL